jgi:peptidoglycan/LPS O-acetylase OafA/YrhL
MSSAFHSPPASRHAAVFLELDQWRILLALAVVAMHAQALGFMQWASAGWTGRLAHDAVIGFFAVSGYSVMQAASSARWQSRTFLIGRWSRLYSLVVPALLLTLCLDTLGRALRPDLYPLWMYNKWPLHLGLHALFLGETWTRSYPAFSNIPYWSLGYEAWYYALLAAWLLPDRLRAGCVALVLVCMGPRVLLLLPCWLMGAMAWWCVEHGRWPAWLAGSRLIRVRGAPSLLLVSLYALWTVSPWAEGLRGTTEALSKQIVAQWGADMRLSYSRWFAADWVTAGVFVSVMLVIAARGVAPTSSDASGRSGASTWKRWLAFHSFGIYLLHYPLLLLAAAFGLARFGAGTGLLTVFAVVALSVAMSAAFSRTRPLWQGLLGRSILR